MVDLSLPEPPPGAKPAFRRMAPAKGFGPVNWLGLWTLCVKETHRFLKIYPQTITTPIVMTLLFYAVFGIAMGGGAAFVGPVPFQTYIVPGLIMMAITQNAFFNTSSALILGKVQGHVIDLVMAPLSPLEWVLAYCFSGILRGLMVGVVTSLALMIFVPIGIVDVGFVAFHAVAGAMMMALLGFVIGIWSDKFDQLATFQNLVVMPATFLSGTFFSISQLPPFWAQVCQINPFFYMIDGFRYGFTGVPDGTLIVGLFVMCGVNLALFVVACRMVAAGVKLKN